MAYPRVIRKVVSEIIEFKLNTVNTLDDMNIFFHKWDTK